MRRIDNSYRNDLLVPRQDRRIRNRELWVSFAHYCGDLLLLTVSVLALLNWAYGYFSLLLPPVFWALWQLTLKFFPIFVKKAIFCVKIFSVAYRTTYASMRQHKAQQGMKESDKLSVNHRRNNNFSKDTYGNEGINNPSTPSPELKQLLQNINNY